MALLRIWDNSRAEAIVCPRAAAGRFVSRDLKRQRRHDIVDGGIGVGTSAPVDRLAAFVGERRRRSMDSAGGRHWRRNRTGRRAAHLQ